MERNIIDRSIQIIIKILKPHILLNLKETKKKLLFWSLLLLCQLLLLSFSLESERENVARVQMKPNTQHNPK